MNEAEVGDRSTTRVEDLSDPTFFQFWRERQRPAKDW